MRLLAVDPSSNVVGLAYFLHADDLHPDTAALKAPKGSETSPASWLDKVDFFTRSIQERSVLWAPDVVAIEDVVVWANAYTALTLGKTWGYLVRVLREEYRQAEMIEVNTATIRAALGLPSRAKRAERQRATREMFPGLATQDAADACAVGMTAYRVIAKLRAQAV